ncbi:hypothetical protein QTP88_011312 [Uroleucon formosanum]
MSKGLKYSSNLCPLLWGSPSIIQRLSQIQTAPERTIFNQKQQANRNPRLLLNFNQNQHHSRKYFPPLCQPQWSTSQSTTIQNLPNTHSSHPKKNQNPTEPCTPSGLNSISNIYKINSERYENNITKLQSTNGSLWRKTKNIIKLKELIPPIKLPNNKLAISDLEKSNTFAEYFYEVFKPNNINPPINQNKINQSLNSALHTTTPPKHFTPNEIKYTISKLKNGKAPGHDSITNNILKKLTNKAILNITHIFNAMLRLSYFPPLWKISTIILVHKPGKPKNTTSSYRPIGLLPSLVGSFEKWAFGILNENDLIEIDEKIKAHIGRNKMTLDLINIQTRIVQSTLNNFNNITNTINENTIKLKTTLEQLICDVNNSVHNIQKIDVSQTLTQHLIFFNIILTEFNQETEELIESIVWGQNQQLHPSIINPNTIINQLKEIEKILPKQLSIPQSPEKINNFLDFLKLLTISLNFMDTYLIYTIYIPLCELDNYVIYHITPFPVPIKNNNYIFIKPSNEYLAISQDNEKFVIFTHQDYMMCKHSLDITICNPHNIIIRNTHDTCEVQLFIDPLNLPVSCDVRHIKTSITFYKKLILKNSWIYASGQSNIVTLVCPDNSKTIKLLGTGILSINEACYVTTPTTILKPNNCYANMTTNIDFVPQFHITNVSTNLMNKINKIQEPTITIPVLKTIDNQLSDISKSSNSLDSVINMIEIEEESIKKGDVFN